MFIKLIPVRTQNNKIILSKMSFLTKNLFLFQVIREYYTDFKEISDEGFCGRPVAAFVRSA